MNTVIKIGRKVYAFYVIAIFGLTFLLLYPLFWLTLRKEAHYKYANRLRRVWAHSLFILTFIGIDIEFEEALDPSQQYIICPNHSSVIDIPLAALCLKGFNFSFMAKEQLARIPVFNIFFGTVDISVKRESKLDSFRAFKRALQLIDGGYSLVIFPEGTTSKIAPQMGEFKNGPFRIAIEKQIPVVPVTFLDNWHIFPYDGTMLCKPGSARAIVHTPIETKGMTVNDVERLKWEVQQVLEQTLKKEYESRHAFSR